MTNTDSAGRSWARAVGVGLVAGLFGAALALIFVALPLFFFASAAEPDQGTGRPFVRTGLVQVAVPFALGVGVLSGAAAVRWRRRGGRLGDGGREDRGRWDS